MTMTSNPEAPLLKLLIGVIVCGAERPPPTPFWFSFDTIAEHPGLPPPLTVFFHLMNTSVLHAICIWDDHIFSTSDFGEMEPPSSFLAVQVHATLGCTCWLHFYFIKILIHHKGLLRVWHYEDICISFVKCPFLV